jgi:hypothetical protein
MLFRLLSDSKEVWCFYCYSSSLYSQDLYTDMNKVHLRTFCISLFFILFKFLVTSCGATWFRNQATETCLLSWWSQSPSAPVARQSQSEIFHPRHKFPNCSVLTMARKSGLDQKRFQCPHTEYPAAEEHAESFSKLGMGSGEIRNRTTCYRTSLVAVDSVMTTVLQLVTTALRPNYNCIQLTPNIRVMTNAQASSSMRIQQ